jgi:hypothetical protein
MEYVAWRIFRLIRKLRLTGIIHLVAKTRTFMEYFKGFEKNAAVRGIFGEKTEQVLRDLKVEFIWFGYMGVDDNDGHLMVNERYLSSGDKQDIYLDIIHELCHVKQHMDGRELFDPRYDYVDRPTEIEAYRYAVLEAKRMGLSAERIREYLKTEWMSDEDLDRLIKNIDVNLEEPDAAIKR